jgi:hypothetical protein
MSQLKDFFEKGDFINIKELYDKKPFILKYPHIRKAFINGHIDIVQWMLSINKHLINKITPDDIEMMFMHCSLTFIQYAITIVNIRFKYNNFCYLHNAFGKNTNKEKMLFIYEKSKKELNKCKTKQKVWENCFRKACTSGNIDLAKWIIECQVIDLNNLKDSVFYWTGYCGEEKIDMLDYLWEITNGLIDFNYQDNILKVTLFDVACTQGRYRVAKWLIDHGYVDVNHVGFEKACMYNNVNIMELLFNDTIVISNSLLDYLIRHHCIPSIEFLLKNNAIKKPLFCAVDDPELYNLFNEHGCFAKRVKNE